jgi:hypothetical protein
VTVNLRRSALWYARRGWRVFPCVPGTKKAAVKEWPRLATADSAQVDSWWRRWPGCNVGVACGPGSGIFVVDVDTHGRDGAAALAKAVRDLGPLPPSVEQGTGGGGRHLVFRHPPGRAMRSRGGGKTWAYPGLEIRGDGGAFMVAPSVHPSGERYRWLVGPHERAPADMPPGWLDAMEWRPPPPTIPVPVRPLRRAGDGQDVGGLIAFVGGQGAGNRNSALYWAARKLEVLRRLGLVGDDRDAELLAAAVGAGLARDEAQATIASARRAEAAA